MEALIKAAVSRSRAVMLILLVIFISGIQAYNNVPKENAPDVRIPIIYVAMRLEGISPEDAERLLLRPMEKELRSIEGIKEMRSNSSEGHAAVVLEFLAGFNSEKALADVREKVDTARPELPDTAEEPEIKEVLFSQFPVLNVNLTGDVPERTLIKIARDLRDKIEEVSSVLRADVAGNREEQVDIVVNPLLVESYGLTGALALEVRNNNILVPAGALDNEGGRFSVKVPGLLDGIWDILSLPIKAHGEGVVTLKDIAEIRKGFKDPTGFARVDGRPSVALEVSKRTGENIIETIEKVRAVVEHERQFWPSNIVVVYSQDQSDYIKNMLADLENNVLFALLLVMLMTLATVGMKASCLVALSIPISFLMGILALDMMGFTLNIVVLFSLIMAVGMLVDNATVVVEYANRRMLDGESHKTAYITAANRMAWPVIASTMTILIVFMPLLFWPGIVGQFMKYLPITLMVTLIAALIMALIFLPVLGAWFGRLGDPDPDEERLIEITERGDVLSLGGFTGWYARSLQTVLVRPKLFVWGVVGALVGVYVLYALFGRGVEFFPKVEPDNAMVQVRARGNLSVYEKDKLMREVERRVLNMDNEVRVFYNRSGDFTEGGRELPEDVIGVIQLEFQNWRVRRSAEEILADIKKRTEDIPGVIVETEVERNGPSQDKPFVLEISSRFPEKIAPAVEAVVAKMEEVGGFKGVTDSRSIPAIEWEMEVNREKAARFNLNIQQIGNFIKMVTNGLMVTTYRPDDADDEVDIVLRYPEENRSILQLDNVRAINTAGQAIPVSSVVERVAKQKVGRVERVEGVRVLTVKADVQPGVLVDDKVKEMAAWLQASPLDPEVRLKFKGEDEEQKEAGNFLKNAFLLALFIMLLMLTIQFNSLFDTLVIMSAIFLSTVGVLFGLLITYQPFGIVMCGVGVITLAGTVVSNNIIFIDTYRVLRKQGMEIKEALVRTGAQRMRPILLTAGTTVVGLVPMVFAMNIDFIARDVTFGAPSTQWWQQLSTSIAGGLTFATILTLFFTPCLLLIGEGVSFMSPFRKLWPRGASFRKPMING